VKIALVCPYSWSVPGGVSNHIEALAGRLRGSGHDVLILAPVDADAPEGVVAVGRSAGIRFNGSVARIAFGPRVAARVRSTLASAAPDVVHVHEPFAPSVGLLATILARAPVVATFHAAAPSSVAYKAAAPLLRPLWRKLAARIAVSEEARRTVERAFGPGVRIVPNGIALERFASVPPADAASRRILFVGRLEPRKGASVLIAAFSRVLDRVPNASLVIVGDGAERSSLESKTAGMPVTFAGRVEPGDLAAAMRDAAVVCAPSLGGESFGIVLLEAMAAGRPVVASSIPGYAAVVRDGTDGLLVPPGDAVGLAEALAAVLGDPGAASGMGAAGRERVARYSWDVVAGEIQEVYAEATARR
jgi:phosphatidyl-myo-inositol alpha-mannosyltransferase